MATHEPEVRTRLVLGPDDHGRLISAEEYASAEYDEPWEYERVEGRLVVISPDGQEHVDTSEPWRDRLVVYKLAHPEVVQIVKSDAWVRVDGGTDRIGDIGVYLSTNRSVPKIPDRVPDLMFEIVSPGQEAHDRDYIEKRADYHRLGVREYIIIDRFLKRVTVLTQTPNGYAERVLTLTDIYTSALLPGFAVPLAEVMNQ